MGEYARYKGQSIKIGTCESMYYLRWDQVGDVHAESNSVDPMSHRFSLRFRFPFPDEDGTRPGDFDPYDRNVRVWGVGLPADGIDHYSVQFKAGNGYLLSVPCPEQSDEGIISLDDGTEKGYKVHRNGYGGAIGVHSQKWVKADEDGPERLVTVCTCRGCGALYRLHTRDMAQEVADALTRSDFEREIAARMLIGYR
jgi:hypothetical protein